MKPLDFKFDQIFIDAASIDENRVAFNYSTTVDIWDHQSRTLVHRSNFVAEILVKISGDRLLMAARDKVTILKLDTFESEENKVEGDIKLIVAIDDKTIVAFIERRENSFLNIFNLDGLRLSKIVDKKVSWMPYFLFRTSENNLVGPSCSGTQVWDAEGNLIEEFKKMDVKKTNPAGMLADNILIATCYSGPEMVKIWNCRTGECLKELKKSIYVGKTSFGFLILNKDKTDCVDAYRMDENFTYLGTIFTGVLSNSKLRTIKHLAADVYLLKFGFFNSCFG
jgi:WD40 repeat protein